MISRLSLAVAAAIVGILLCAPVAPAQGRGGMRRPAAAPRARSVIGIAGRNVQGRQIRRLNDSAFWLPPYFYPYDDSDYETDYPAPPAVQPLAAQPVASAPPPAPVEPLLLENRNGEWVRVPTGSEIPIASQPAPPQSDSASVSNSRPGFVELPAASAPIAPLPPAVIVFRDGHTEEVAKYMIQGQNLYTSSDYYATGSWTKKIPLAQLDIPASLKLNKERGTKFNLPSSPNEVMIRF